MGLQGAPYIYISRLRVKYSECASDLIYPACTAHTPYYTVINGLAALRYFSTLPHKRRHVREKVIEHKIFFLFSLNLFLWNISHSKNNSASIINVHQSACKVPVIYVRF
jgi:hypothetical protein